MIDRSSPWSALAPWVPSPFDVVKELNAHAGRLATMLGLVLAATSFSLASGPIHDALTPFNPSTNGVIYGFLVQLGLSLVVGGASVLSAMNPALPRSIDKKSQWDKLIDGKHTANTNAAFAVGASLVSLVAAWLLIYVAAIQLPSTPFDVGTVALIAIPTVTALSFLLLGGIIQWRAKALAKTTRQP